MIPVIAIVGRPNVGKSTLFNMLTKTRASLVVDLPGVTRDRIYGEGSVNDQAFIVIDTGGLGDFEENVKNKHKPSDTTLSIEAMMADQAWQAVIESDIIFFMVDAKVGCINLDEVLAKQFRKIVSAEDKKIFLLVNKTDGLNPEVAVADFYTLRLGEPIPIAASHGSGIMQLMEKALTDANLKYADADADADSKSAIAEAANARKPQGIKVAIIGRPNVGKSTLVNRILGEERMLVFDEAGTTRDSIYIPYERDGHLYTIIDTAGLRRKARVSEALEKFSIVKTLQAIEDCDVVICVLDARDGITEQDLSLLGFILHSGRSVVIAINKWDGLLESKKQEIKRALKHRLLFIDYAKLHFISALHGTGVGTLFKSVQEAYHAATKELRTSELTRVLAEAVVEHQPPLVRGRRIKLRYAHAGGHRPPIIVIHGNQTEEVPETYKRYLMNTFRKAFRLVGTPIRLEFVTSDNPYKGRYNKLTPRQQHKRKRLIKFHNKKSK